MITHRTHPIQEENRKPQKASQSAATNSTNSKQPPQHYENTSIQINRKFYLQKRKCLDKNLWYIIHISAQNIACGYSLGPLCGSNEYTQYMFLSSNTKNNVYPCKPQFYYVKCGLRGSILYRHVFVMEWSSVKSSGV